MKARQLDKYMLEAIQGQNRGASCYKGSVLDQRDAERVPLRAYVTYMTDEPKVLARREGWLVDLSKTGCKIAGPPPTSGISVTLVLHFDDKKDPLRLDAATVTWTNIESFGVRFPKLRSEERQRLQELLLRFATIRGRSQAHTAFRLA